MFFLQQNVLDNIKLNHNFTAEIYTFWSKFWNCLARFITFTQTHTVIDNKTNFFHTNQTTVVYKIWSNLASKNQSSKRFIVRERFKFWSIMNKKSGESIQELFSEYGKMQLHVIFFPWLILLMNHPELDLSVP